MIDIDSFFNDIDRKRFERVRELAEMNHRFTSSDMNFSYDINAKAIIVLAYAHWEGFYNECIQTYISLLQEKGCKVKDISWNLLYGLLSNKLTRLKDKNHSPKATCDFISELYHLIDMDFENFDINVISSRSNLKFDVLRQNYQILGFDIDRFQDKRIRIDTELVKWRNSIAHGDFPDLSSAILSDHIHFTQNLLLTLSDQFQEEMQRLI